MAPEGPNIFKEEDVVFKFAPEGQNKRKHLFVFVPLWQKKNKSPKFLPSPCTYNNKHILIFF
jgi:hypothetical protein